MGRGIKNIISKMTLKEKAAIVTGMMKGLRSGSRRTAEQSESEAISKDMIQAMMKYMPMRSLISFADISSEAVENLVAELNK